MAHKGAREIRFPDESVFLKPSWINPKSVASVVRGCELTPATKRIALKCETQRPENYNIATSLL